jgi:hypothetical protein
LAIITYNPFVVSLLNWYVSVNGFDADKKVDNLYLVESIL